jgi:PAS domain S-box-containing protein
MQDKEIEFKTFKDLPIKFKIGMPLLLIAILGMLVVFGGIYGILTSPNTSIFFSLVFLGCFQLIITILIWLITLNNISKPLNDLAQASSEISKGNLEVMIETHTQDEIGHITNSTLYLSESIRKAREFAKNIGQGNYEVESLLDEQQNETTKNSLFYALMGMRDQLKIVAESDEKRNWITKGLASFTEILRSNDTDLKQLGQKIITGLARYLQASQGAVFILNEEDPQQIYLELLASYALDEARFENKKIIIQDNFAEGLVGQAFLERDTIFLTEVPSEYLNIASGLGASNPSSILIVPLELNNRIEGIIEIASLHKLESHEVEFVERIAENIASAILTIKVNENTKKLLRETQALAQKLQTQEEELRQNYEELQATQEMVQKKNDLIEEQKIALEKALTEQTEKSEMLQAQEEEMRQNMEELVATQEQMMITQAELDGQLNAINSSTICKLEWDLNGFLISANPSFCELMGFTLNEIKGKSYWDFWDRKNETEDEYQKFWNNLREGVLQTGTFKRHKKNNDEVWLNAVYSPVLNRKGQTQKIIQLAFDITQSKRLLEETQSQAKILRAQEKELRQNMEELKSTQDELNKKNQAIIELKEEEALNAQIKAKEIESKNQLITSSIQYAQNIQRAILPLQEKISETVNDFFVIYLPKDIVSGDFYWFSHIENKRFFAAVDCTGHGVPGAFMSIIGNTLLNEIVNVQQIFETDKILEMLHLGVRTKLRQKENNNYDGMDLAICKIEDIDNKQVKLTFSGAKRPLYYYSPKLNGTDLAEIKGDRKSIGGWQQEEHRTFTKTEVILNKGDLVYLTTDGFADNPNLDRKKFGEKRFKNLVLQNINRNLRQQKKVILAELGLHQQGTEQRDDITVIGIKI